MAQTAGPQSADGFGHEPPMDAPLNPDRFAAAYRGAYRLLWLIAAGVTGDRTLADDIVQEAAVTALGKLDQFRPGTSFNAWMGQIVRFTALNRSRKEHRRHAASLESEGQEPPAPTTGIDESTAPPIDEQGRLNPGQALFDDRLVAALNQLSEEARACLLLRTVGGLDYQAIAQVLAMPPGTAMSHVHRARHTLRTALAAKEGES